MAHTWGAGGQDRTHLLTSQYPQPPPPTTHAVYDAVRSKSQLKC